MVPLSLLTCDSGLTRAARCCEQIAGLDPISSRTSELQAVQAFTARHYVPESLDALPLPRDGVVTRQEVILIDYQLLPLRQRSFDYVAHALKEYRALTGHEQLEQPGPADYRGSDFFCCRSDLDSRFRCDVSAGFCPERRSPQRNIHYLAGITCGQPHETATSVFHLG